MLDTQPVRVLEPETRFTSTNVSLLVGFLAFFAVVQSGPKVSLLCATFSIDRYNIFTPFTNILPKFEYH